MTTYVSRKEVLKYLKIHYQTLYRMENRGEIEVIRIGTRKMYYHIPHHKYMKEKNIIINKQKKICYCRVLLSKTKRRSK